MSISVDVHLLSGKVASIEVEADESVESLKRRAQRALVVPKRARLLKPSGEVLDRSTNDRRSEVDEWRQAQSPCEPGAAQSHQTKPRNLCVRRSVG